MPLPLRLPPDRIGPIEGISPLEGVLLVLSIYLTMMAAVWFFTKEKKT